MFKFLLCLVLEHAYVYLHSFRDDSDYPNGGMRVRCSRCQKSILIAYPKIASLEK